MNSKIYNLAKLGCINVSDDINLYTDDTYTLAVQNTSENTLTESTPESLANQLGLYNIEHLLNSFNGFDTNELGKIYKAIDILRNKAKDNIRLNGYYYSP